MEKKKQIESSSSSSDDEDSLSFDSEGEPEVEDVPQPDKKDQKTSPSPPASTLPKSSEPEKSKIEKFCTKMKDLLDLERESEIEETQTLLETLSPKVPLLYTVWENIMLLCVS